MASLVQRAGLQPTGLVHDAELWWVSPARPQPYEQADIDASSAELTKLGRRAVTGEASYLAGHNPGCALPI